MQIPALNQSDLMIKLLHEKKSAREFQERKHEDWNENYELYRNKVRTNRLTQRQAVNIPMMKETIKTLLSKIDDPPMIDWEELSGDEFKELLMQEKWNAFYENDNLEGIDVQDKKTALLAGRTFKKLNWVDDKVDLRALDIYDVVVDPMVDPLDLETAHFMLHQNIFRPLRNVLSDSRYSNEGKQKLKNYMTSKQGLIQSGENKQEFDKKMERLRAMGVDDHEFALFGMGDSLVNLTEHISKIWNVRKQNYEKRVIVYADDQIELLNEPLLSMLGIDRYPYVTWGDDVETNDFWSDGPADLIRVPNKVSNIWFSQMIEGRTLNNFGMHWYASGTNYTPQTYEPGPGRMLPSPPLQPGQSIKDVIMPVAIDRLDDNMTALQYLTQIVERGTAATAIEKGVGEGGKQTLGEVEILVGKAMERTVAMAKFYKRSWYNTATLWYELTSANQRKKETLYKTGADGKIWPKVVRPSEWKSEAGFRPIVRSSSEAESEKTKGMQKLIYIQSLFPNNPAVRRIMQSRALEMVDVTPAELREVEEAEKQMQQSVQQQMTMAQTDQMGQGAEAQPLQQVNEKVSELNQLQNAPSI